jgi:hypothetical protein
MCRWERGDGGHIFVTGTGAEAVAVTVTVIRSQVIAGVRVW